MLMNRREPATANLTRKDANHRHRLASEKLALESDDADFIRTSLALQIIMLRAACR